MRQLTSSHRQRTQTANPNSNPAHTALRKISSKLPLPQIVGEITALNQQIEKLDDLVASGKASAIDERRLGQLDREVKQKNEHRIDSEQALYNATQKFVLCEAELHKYDQMAEAIAQEIELEVTTTLDREYFTHIVFTTPPSERK